MLHPDYQYSPKLITAMASLIAVGEYDVVIASRILGVGALKGGMPVYKYISNRFLTLVENLMLFHKLSEYHTGYRAFSRKVLESLPLMENSDDFVFDNEMLAQIIFWGYKIGEISCPTKYFPEASSINFWRSSKYGLSCLLTSLKFRLQKMHLGSFKVFDDTGQHVRTIYAIQDLTDLKHTEEQLRHAQKMEAVGQLTGGVAHDFNNLLAVILGNLELIELEVDERGEAQEWVEQAIAATERGASLTQRLLTFSRRQSLQPESVDVHRLVEDLRRQEMNGGFQL